MSSLPSDNELVDQPFLRSLQLDLRKDRLRTPEVRFRAKCSSVTLVILGRVDDDNIVVPLPPTFQTGVESEPVPGRRQPLVSNDIAPSVDIGTNGEEISTGDLAVHERAEESQVSLLACQSEKPLTHGQGYGMYSHEHERPGPVLCRLRYFWIQEVVDGVRKSCYDLDWRSILKPP